MKLVKQTASVISCTTNALKLIEYSGRKCYSSTNKITDDSYIEFNKGLVQNGHYPVLEHASISFDIVCDRGIMAELTRHRHSSFCVESTRYNNYSKTGLEFVIPTWVENIQEGEYTSIQETGDKQVDIWFSTLFSIEKAYRGLVADGWKPQQARSILPNALKVSMVMTSNFTQLRHIFKERLNNKAHPQMIELMGLLLDLVKTDFSPIFDDFRKIK